MSKANVKNYEMALEQFGHRLKLDHYRIAEAVDNDTGDMKFVAILDLADKAVYYLDTADAEVSDTVKVGRLAFADNSIKQIPHSVVSCSDLRNAMTDSVLDPLKSDEDNTELFDYINNSENYKSYVKDKLGLLPCYYGLKKKRNGRTTTQWYMFSIAYQS